MEGGSSESPPGTASARRRRRRRRLAGAGCRPGAWVFGSGKGGRRYSPCRTNLFAGGMWFISAQLYLLGRVDGDRRFLCVARRRIYTSCRLIAEGRDATRRPRRPRPPARTGVARLAAAPRNLARGRRAGSRVGPDTPAPSFGPRAGGSDADPAGPGRRAPGPRDCDSDQSGPAVVPGPSAVFRSRGNLRMECSTDLLTLASESTGSHELVVEGCFRRWCNIIEHSVQYE